MLLYKTKHQPCLMPMYIMKKATLSIGHYYGVTYWKGPSGNLSFQNNSDRHGLERKTSILTYAFEKAKTWLY